MASTSKEFEVSRDINKVWEFVSDMGNWASQMPGYVSHESSSADDSAWTLNVDLGPFSRSIVVDVHVSQWNSPGEVVFGVKGRYEPFTGGGVYRARETAGGTAIVLDFHAEPGGSMAKIIAPMVGPVLERVANEFSANLKAALEGGTEAAASPAPQASASGMRRAGQEGNWLQRLLRRLKTWFRPA